MSVSLLSLVRALSGAPHPRSVEARASTPSGEPAPALDQVEVCGLSHDSRLIEPGWLYVALPGRLTHGARFIPQALERGAVAVALPQGSPLPPELPASLPLVWLQAPRAEMAKLSELVWGEPLRSLELIGVTGTNGKTTTTTLLAEVLTKSDGDVGLLGTIKARGGGLEVASSMTTLESSALHQRFAQFVSAGLKRCVMEVSSIGVAEERVAAARFKRAAFLNLSEDHLDYHLDMERYAHAKLRLFSELLAPHALVVINIDDPLGERAVEASLKGGAEVWRLSAAEPLSNEGAAQGDVQVFWRSLEVSAEGLSGELVTPQGALTLRSPLLGDFNAYNVATAASIALSLGVEPTLIAEALEGAVVPGRMERVTLPQSPQPSSREPSSREPSSSEPSSGTSAYPTVLVDYAHTPDALERALQALRASMSASRKRAEGSTLTAPARAGKLWCLFGCGGDRDAHKRPLMGAASARADVVVLTSDNPRREPPLQIMEQALEGCLSAGLKRSASPSEKAVWLQPDRAQAIASAVALLEPEDVLLVAGKGHEPYQEVGEARLPFDDAAHVRAALVAWREAQQSLYESLNTTRLCQDTGATLRGGAHRALRGGEIDTRRLKVGEVFFCLRGARDGHEFALSALERGAAAVVTRLDWSPSQEERERLEAQLKRGAAWLAVRDPEEALRAFATAHRARAFQGVMVGLTGSNGKTSTKELLAAALSQLGPTLATLGNFNNHLGVPLTLLRVRPQHRFAVVEMGMNARGEIAQLAALARPHVGLITTIAAAHLEGLGSIEEIARAKGELFVELGERLGDEGWAVLSEALPLKEVALEGVKARLFEVERRLRLEEAQVSVEGSSATLLYMREGTQEGARYPLTLQLVGEHQLANAQLALGAALIAAQLTAQTSEQTSEQNHLITKTNLTQERPTQERLTQERLTQERPTQERLTQERPTQELLPFGDASLTSLLFGLASAPPPPMRGEVSRLPQVNPQGEPAHLWLDCYNANPQSTLTSLSSFWRSGLRGVIVLGSLKELGETSLELHEALGREVARLSASLPSPTHEGELIITVGEEARAIAKGLRAEGYPHGLTSLSFEQLDEARELALSKLLSPSLDGRAPSLFVKGSRSGRLEVLAKALVEALVEALQRDDHPTPTPSTPLKER